MAPPDLSRRDALRVVASLSVAATACSEEASAGTTADAGTVEPPPDASGSDAVVADAAVDVAGDTAPDAVPDAVVDSSADAAVDAAVDAVADGWVTGGTAAMTGRDAYPDPFADADPALCSQTCEMVLGPCHVESPERRDISDGWDGLPVRVALRVVDEDCNPVKQAAVEIWHTNHFGSYSGDAAAMCNLGEDDRVAGYFRGYQTSDDNGRVDFDTCFPGWYSGRAIHIHFRVQVDGYDPADNAPAAGTSQLYFPDDLNTAIFTSEPLYRDAGLPNRTNVTDGISSRFPDLSNYTFEIERLPDGAMLAWAQVVIRSRSEQAC